MNPLAGQGKGILTGVFEKALKDHKTLSVDEKEMICRMGGSLAPVEGIDYQINANGDLVFSAVYHLRRGSCCGNDCLNCPY